MSCVDGWQRITISSYTEVHNYHEYGSSSVIIKYKIILHTLLLVSNISLIPVCYLTNC